MRITSADVIRNSEKELMDAITGDLDWGSIERIFREKHRLSIEEDVEYKRGDLVVHDNRIAYRLEFAAKVTLSVLLDREGNYLSVDAASPGGEEPPAQGAGTGYEEVLSRFAASEHAPPAADEAE
jgi:hypothetical protein